MKKIILVIIGILVVIILGGYLLPREFAISKSITINAPAAHSFEEINNLDRWANWEYWSNLYKGKMNVTYGDVKSGVNGTYSWDGEESGKGKATITESIPDKSIKTELDFMEQGTAQTWYTFEPAGDSTKVTMGFETDMGMNPLMRWVGALFMKSEMNKALEYDLEKLKTIAEAKPKFTVKFSEENLTPVRYVSLMTTMSPQDAAAVSAQMGKMYGELFAMLTKSKIQIAGYPFSLYPKFSDESMDMVVALPVPENAKVPAKYKVEKTAGGKAIKATHMGDYAKLMDTHNQMVKYLEVQKLEMAGAPMEVYVTDPGVVKDTAQWVTEIYYPVN